MFVYNKKIKLSLTFKYESWTHPCTNAFGTISIGQRVARLLKSHRGRADMSDHDGSTVPAQRVLSIKS